MRFFSTAVALASVPAAVYGATQTILVGDQGSLAYNPPNITAAVGDTINFQFMAKNHSVTQSTFAAPCAKAMFNGSAGVSSGFLAVSNSSSNGSSPTWSITLKSTSPLWFHCGQVIPANHCQAGMVFSINATPEKSHDMFVAAAKASTSDPAAGASNGTTPSGATPSGGAPAVSDASGSGTAAPAAATDASGSGTAAAASAATTDASGSGAAAAAAGSSSDSAASSSGTTAADNSSPTTSGASKTIFTRGAAGLLTVAAAVSAVLL